jgi:hypothetical protein
MADPFRPRTLRLVANLSCVRILCGEFEGQRGRFISFCLPPNGIAAPNGSAHAVTTFHFNILLDSGLSVNVSASFLRLLHMDESSPFIRISPVGITYLAEPPPPGYVSYSSRTPCPGSPDVSGVVSSNTDQASIPDDGRTRTHRTCRKSTGGVAPLIQLARRYAARLRQPRHCADEAKIDNRDPSSDDDGHTSDSSSSSTH